MRTFDGAMGTVQNYTGIGKTSKVFSIFDQYGTKTGKTIEDILEIIGE